jgi:hypothetical protein
MDELLKKLLEAEILTEDTKNELATAFKAKLEENIQIARAEAHALVAAELNEQWITERETLIEALDAKVTEALAEEISELRTDIERFRDLEAEFAENLVEAKDEMSDVLKTDIGQLIEKLDAFLEVRLTSELEELREDFAEIKKNEFGKTVFESFVTEFKKHYAGDDSIESKLSEAEQRLEDSLTALEEAEKKTAKLERSIKLERVLSPLTGKVKEVMEAILKNVDTNMLEDAYSTYVGRVLKETAVETEVQTSEKETKVLAEGKTKQAVSGRVKSGNNDDQIINERKIDEADIKQSSAISEATVQHLRRIAGLA